METIDSQRLSILDAKEERVAHQRRLLANHHHALLVIRANYPGANKHNPHTSFVVSVTAEIIKQRFSPLHCSATNSAEGLIYHLIIDLPGNVLKQAMIEYENHHPLGRLVDLDVMEETKSYDRSMFGQEARRCFVCDGDAHGCVRAARHSTGEISGYFIAVVDAYVRSSLANQILFALVAEASVYPKFGLVTPFSMGSHKDMDYFMLLASAHAIAPMLAEAIHIDTSLSYEKMLDSLRGLGKRIERVMFQVTGGINTHKGAIFLFLILTQSVRLASSFDQISEKIKLLCASLQAEFDAIDARANASLLSHGELLYQTYGIQGIRGLAMGGCQTLFDIYLPFFRQCTGSLQERMVETLLYLMETCEDTTILHRGGQEALCWLQQQAKRARVHPEYRQAFEEQCIQKHLSAGGSADLLALVVWLYQIETEGELPWK